MKGTGIKIARNAKGHVKSVTLDTSSTDEDVQDLLDIAVALAAKNEPRVPLEVVKKKLAKKHGWKDV